MLILEKKAEDHIKNNMVKCVREQIEYFEFAKYSYIAGAKENGVIWHDLTKNPNDLPIKDIGAFSEFVITNVGIGYYIDAQNKWFTYYKETGTYIDNNEVIAWCEIPKFEVEE